MSITTHSVRIAGKTYDLTLEDRNEHWTVRVKQYPGIVSTASEEGRAIDNVIRAIVDKISENKSNA